MKPTPLTDKFIHDLKEKMDKNGLRQTQLARWLGTSKQKVHYWFKRMRNPNGESILKIQAWEELE